MKALGLALWMSAVTAVAFTGKPGLLGVAAFGEATAQTTSDIIEHTVLPQIGVSFEYRTRFLAVFNTPTVGYYNGRPFLEDYLGVEAGRDFGWARPALTGGMGVQSYYVTNSDYESGDSWRKHEVRFPLGFGFRLWVLQSCYGEWQSRLFQEDQGGVPWWKMEFGCQVL